ncbi:MAG: SAM-dependent chlorinase/fluorinase [Actinomycetota bacterium]|nr:SAM-dependent chlorinase/fluorinase [Acidimicrobiales bacterium]MEC8922114.1 SAM-dependent chlorinase/fluorinase [Actinomycetota bacterium]MED5552012.1 SAM-dependent chlorinase/fluorinase [Actinomycetota bacterium]MEE3140083.1 SAM-dependent chlorinase/fluorinase [Actinomycetota bacterium]MEE3186538.1 SAM-dependent chlorinase/fluorinase [Actinomycetota bacterium]|tara:strand:+ start:472 stop:1272 length:801 start_codon:yes stop_codon:yes gene_type:complete
MTRFDTVTCLTDMGISDESVGLLHSILRDLSPASRVIDLCHDIHPGDVRAGSLMLARSVPYLASGLVLASVGSVLDRPAVAVEVGDGQAVLVGPDNGLLGAAVAVVGGADRAVQLTNTEFHIASPGVQHPARDVIGPVSAHLAAGRSLEEVGDHIEPSLLLPSLVPVPRLEDSGSISAEVIGISRRGAAQLNIDRDTLSEMGDVLILEFGEEQRVVRLQAPTEVNPGQLALVDDEYGLLAVATGRDEGLMPQGLEIGTEVTVREAT